MTEPGSTTTARPGYAELAAITDPVECARRITEIARSRGNLPRDLARLRVRCLIEARIADGRKVTWLALKVGLQPSGISRLTKTTPASQGASA